VRSAYPLQWPIGWPRTDDWKRKRGPFQMPPGKARYELNRELSMLGAEDIVVSSNVMVRQDGLPYAKQPRVDDPGVVLYFTLNGQEVCMPCDRWSTVDANLRAIGMAVEAIRGMERWGTGQMVDAAFRGFKALPESIITPPPSTSWYTVLGVSSEATREEIKAAYRRMAAATHPDAGGDEAQFARITKAYQHGLDHLTNG
jgi:hypothetical protein